MIILSILAGAWLVADLAAIMGICKTASRRIPASVVKTGTNSSDQTVFRKVIYFEFERADEELKSTHPGTVRVPLPSAPSIQ